MKLKFPLILASQSPRRIELLKQRNFQFEVFPADIEEDLSVPLGFSEMVEHYANLKADTIAQKIKNPNQIILAADTIVVFNHKIMGKPMNLEQARGYLLQLSGNWHEVYSGIAIHLPAKNLKITTHEKTKVFFRYLSESMINDYLINQPPLDKAGAYGIQDFGAFFVENIEGCFFNVVGLPLNRLLIELENLNLIEWEK